MEVQSKLAERNDELEILERNMIFISFLAFKRETDETKTIHYLLLSGIQTLHPISDSEIHQEERKIAS